MAEFLEYDPHTGIRTDTTWDEASQGMTLHRSADVEPILDFAKGAVNEGGLNRTDIKRGWWMYATLPPIVQLQMRAKGIDISRADHQSRMMAEINEHYPHLKCTSGMDGPRSAKKIYLRSIAFTRKRLTLASRVI